MDPFAVKDSPGGCAEPSVSEEQLALNLLGPLQQKDSQNWSSSFPKLSSRKTLPSVSCVLSSIVADGTDLSPEDSSTFSLFVFFLCQSRTLFNQARRFTRTGHASFG